jgi:hypothetical protein
MSAEQPWLSMWVHPKSTIQSVVNENPRKSLWLLAWIYGFNALLNIFQTIPIALQIGLIPMFLVAFLLAPLWGYLSFSIWGAVVVWVGRLFKGQGTFETVRASYAWACVPMIGSAVLWLILLFFYGGVLFVGAPEPFVSNGTAVTLLGIFVVKLVFSIWTLVLFVQTLSQVQHFSILRSIGNLIVAAIVLIFAFYALSFLTGYLLEMFAGSRVAAIFCSNFFN